jgi:hypothetical protein
MPERRKAPDRSQKRLIVHNDALRMQRKAIHKNG